jgi:hypothetical protein
MLISDKIDSSGDSKMSEREEAESVPPKVKSWRDAGNKPYRQDH